jgi:transmembrane sensor
MPLSDQSNSDDAIELAAARWLARRDRGLTPAEQDEYLQWLREDRRHARKTAQLDRVWRSLDPLGEWRPKHSAPPNPDLLAPVSPWRRFRRPAMFAALAGVAVLMVGVYAWRHDRAPVLEAPSARSGVRVIPRPERIALADGSVVELNRDGKIETAFTAGERRVRLLRGEAHFAVAKNPARPFVVVTGAVAVRAVGTAFDVRRDPTAVEVLVTEGKVHVERSLVSGATAAPTPLQAGQRAVVDMKALEREPVISSVSASELEQTLGWQSVHLEFADLPLADVVAEFNLRNTQQIVIGDVETGRLRVGGNFRADNVDAFVRLIEASFGIAADRRDDGTLLLHRRQP